MPEFNIAFANLSHFLPFLHIAASIAFIGFQACFLYMAKFFMKDIANNHKKYALAIAALKRLGYALYGSLGLLCVTSVLLEDSDFSKSADPMLNTILATKWALFFFLFINILYSHFRLNKAIKSMQQGEYIELHENLIVIIYYFIPLNVVVGLFGVYLGVAYRGF